MEYKQQLQSLIDTEEQELTRLANEYHRKTEAFNALQALRFSSLRAYLQATFADADDSVIKGKIEESTARFQLLDKGTTRRIYDLTPNHERWQVPQPGFLLKLEKPADVSSTKHYDEPESRVFQEAEDVMSFLLPVFARHIAEQKDQPRRAAAYFVAKWPGEANDK